MTPERWQQIEAVLQGALDRPPSDRALFVDEACSGDAELRDEANSLIKAHDEAGDFIDQPAIIQDSEVLVQTISDLNLGRQVGPYVIIERLGGGGMGEVYLARDERLNRLVALKILPAYFAADDTRLKRFQREARAASALNHPNILTIHEVGEGDGVDFIATEFIDGPTLREIISSGDLEVDQVLEITEQVASALSAAHAAGIVHRDIKPENIMRRSDGLVKILDFGIAKLMEPEAPKPFDQTRTEVGVVMGTVDYMSPEQARGLSVDERTDIWSLGVVLYEMLTRRLPFTGATRMDSMVAILEREPTPLFAESAGILPAMMLERIIAKCLTKAREERYQSADELLTDLRKAKEAPATLPAGLSGSRRQHNYLALITAAVLVGLIAAAVAYRGWRNSSPPPANLPTPVAKTYTAMNDAEQLTFIREQEKRISTMIGDDPVELNDDAARAIKFQIDWYVARRGKEGNIGEVLERARSRVPLIARAFAARKVPVIVGVYLPVIESGYRDCFENEVGAKGLFQFLPQTAKHYGVSPEEMCDVEKMAPAAAHYMADRMAELGEDSQSMTLVLVSYNRGPEAVRDSLRQLRGAENYRRNFWTLFAHREKLDETFRKESAWYVPAFFAAAIIGENPQRFELTTPPLSTVAN